MMDRLHKSFRRSENQLISVLERRKGEIKVNNRIEKPNSFEYETI